MEAVDKKKFADNRFFYVIFLAVILAGIILRVNGLACSFEYDEIWTIKNWLPHGYWDLLRSLHNASNHPLSSVGMKFIYQFSGKSLFWLRLPHFLCGMALLPIIYLNAKLLTGKRLTALITLSLAAFHPGLIYYSHCARGYSLATFGVALFMFMSSCWIFKATMMGKYQRYLTGIIMFLSVVIACMSIPSVILFIVPVMLIHATVLIKRYWDKNHISQALVTLVKSNPELIVAWFFITVFVLFLYVGNYYKFKNATVMAAGTSLDSFASLWIFLSTLFPKLISWSILPLCFVPLLRKKQHKLFFACAFIFLFSFSSLIFAKGGPPRTYLPLVPMFCLLAANGTIILAKLLLNLLKFRSDKLFILIVFVITCTAIISSYRNDKWAGIDWFGSFDNIKKIPRNIMVVYGACETYALANNIGAEVYVDNFSRISLIKSGQEIIFINIPNQTVNGLNSNGGEIACPINEKGKPVEIGSLPSTVYKLKKITPQSRIKDKSLLAVIPFIPLELKNAAVNYLFTMPGSKWLLLNCFLTVSETRNGQKYSSATMACPGGHGLNAAQLLSIEDRSKGKLRFYTFEDYDSKP